MMIVHCFLSKTFKGISPRIYSSNGKNIVCMLYYCTTLEIVGVVM